MIQKAVVLVFLLTASLFSCNKHEEQKTIVNGRLIEYGTRKPIENAKVFVLCYNTPIFGPSQFPSILDTLRTDSDGRFYLEYKSDEICGGAYLDFSKPGYQFNGFADININVNNDLEVVLDPDAWFKLVTIPDLGMWSILGFGGSFSPHTVGVSNGIEEQIFYHPGGRDVVIHWGPFGIPGHLTTDTIFLAPLDTTVYTIHY